MASSIVYTASIITGICVIVGTLMIIPIVGYEGKPKIILSFEIQPYGEISNFCEDLSKILNQNNIKSVIFISGKIAEDHPSCVKNFGNNVDIGSQTYNYVELPQVFDYSEQLREVEKGKASIDKIGNLNSKLFKAPNMATDENIYSLLSKNSIEFDLSYYDHYNKFYDGRFLRYEMNVINLKDIKSTDYSKMDKNLPSLIEFDNSDSVKDIEDSINFLKSKNIEFVNPSDIMKKNLTNRN